MIPFETLYTQSEVANDNNAIHAMAGITVRGKEAGFVPLTTRLALIWRWIWS